MSEVRTTTVLVIGAGPSGLAVGAELTRNGVDFEIVDRAPELGWSWRNHYHRLHLHTVKGLSNLPGLPFGSDVADYPSRADIVSYLERYADKFGLKPHLDETVQHAEHKDSGWQIETDRHTWHADHLVIATGYNRSPKRPTWPGLESFGGSTIHSSEYRDGKPFRGQRVLVVGSGNSGAEIAVDLWEYGATPTMCIRGPIHVVPRETLGVSAQRIAVATQHLPTQLADRLAMPMLKRTVGDLTRFGIVRPTMGPAQMLLEQGRVPLIDIGTIALIKQGAIGVIGALESFDATRVTCVDGGVLELDAVVLATGYEAAVTGFVPEVAEFLNERGYPTERTAEARGLGLHFVGYSNPITGALREIAIEAT
ncbi:MAG: indole-3-pyruvate monooxygenase, partial [Myxococcota bacterium]